MVLAGVAFANGRFHEAGEGWEDVDGRVNALVVKLAVDVDLAFRDVPCKIRNRMCDICGSISSYYQHYPEISIPSLGMVRIGICVIEPLRPWTRPARSYIVDKSVYM